VEITEVRIKLMEDNSGSNERLQAFCSITLDDMFVIRDLKIIEGAKGFFVAMPSRKLSDRCGHCGTKNHLRSRFCNQCGVRLDETRALRDSEGRAKLHADIAHPINSGCREKLQAAVLAAYADELERAKLPGYVSRYDDFDDGDWDNANSLGNPYGNYAPPMPPAHNPYMGNYSNMQQHEPPLRRGPLRPHTQHQRTGGPLYRGPHVPRRSSDMDRVHQHDEHQGYHPH
jgi:stage V sporulation protein G